MINPIRILNLQIGPRYTTHAKTQERKQNKQDKSNESRHEHEPSQPALHNSRERGADLGVATRADKAHVVE